jgi:hypothetical protein
MCWNQIFQVNFFGVKLAKLYKKHLIIHNKFRDCKISFFGLPKKKTNRKVGSKQTKINLFFLLH